MEWEGQEIGTCRWPVFGTPERTPGAESGIATRPAPRVLGEGTWRHHLQGAVVSRESLGWGSGNRERHFATGH